MKGGAAMKLNVKAFALTCGVFWAMGLFPVVLWAIDRVIERPRPVSIALLGTCGASVILSHNISAMIFLPFAAVYGLWMLIPKYGATPLPEIDGKPVPVIGPAEWASIPEGWLRNLHRSNGGAGKNHG